MTDFLIDKFDRWLEKAHWKHKHDNWVEHPIRVKDHQEWFSNLIFNNKNEVYKYLEQLPVGTIITIEGVQYIKSPLAWHSRKGEGSSLGMAYDIFSKGKKLKVEKVIKFDVEEGLKEAMAVKEIQFLLKKYPKIRIKIVFGSGAGEAAYNPASKVIMINHYSPLFGAGVINANFSLKEGDQRVNLLIHEIGHYIYGTLNEIQLFNILSLFAETPQGISQYGNQNQIEEFAEYVLFYFKNPKKVKKNNILIYKFLDDLIGWGVKEIAKLDTNANVLEKFQDFIAQRR